ncbi:hypothetical protein, partial [Rhodococcus sp. NPDC060176]|uniref:hypothetical protein n=1 Tax=Rhodococcus sp. NPDC060176 TaxID=3347062 RepID=UPI00364FA5A6
ALFPATEPAEVNGNICAEGNSSPTVVHVHHHDIEEHAASFNEGYDEAVRQLAEPAEGPHFCRDSECDACNATEYPAPAEPAEEETTAEDIEVTPEMLEACANLVFDTEVDASVAHALQGMAKELRHYNAELAVEPTSSPVVPAPTETGDLRVHNHGPNRGPGPDSHCPERRVDGRLRGQCMAPTKTGPLLRSEDTAIIRNVIEQWRDTGKPVLRESTHRVRLLMRFGFLSYIAPADDGDYYLPTLQGERVSCEHCNGTGLGHETAPGEHADCQWCPRITVQAWERS